MAGKHLAADLADLLQGLANDYYERERTDVAIGLADYVEILDYVTARIESGTTLKQLALELATALHRELTYNQLTAFLRQRYGQERYDNAMSLARLRASHWMAEDALDVVDKVAYDSVSVQQARAKANQRTWLASRYNPKQYGQQSGSASVNVQVNVASLHLEALQRIEASVSSQVDSTKALSDSTSTPSVAPDQSEM